MRRYDGPFLFESNTFNFVMVKIYAKIFTGPYTMGIPCSMRVYYTNEYPLGSYKFLIHDPRFIIV